MKPPNTKESKPKNTIHKVFKNKSNHVRSVWRILIYFAFVILLFEISDFFQRSFLMIEGEDLSKYDLLQNRIVDKFLKLLSVFIPAILFLKFLDKRPTGLLGTGFYKGTVKELFIGISMGLIIASVSISVLCMTGLAHFTYNGLSQDMLLYLLYCLLILVISAAYEEILFRGYVFQSLIEGTNLLISLIVFSIIFGLSHFEHGIGNIIFALISGVFLGLLYYKTRALWMCIGVHFVWNFIQAPIFGIGVSEREFLRQSLFDYQPTDINVLIGPETLTLIIQCLFMIGLTIFVWKSKRIKASEYNKKLWSKYDM